MALIPPTKTQQDIIDYKIKLNSQKTEDDIKKILSWIREQNEFPIAKDLKKKEFIETFYFQCKFNCEKTIKTYKNYCKIRKTEFFHNRDPFSPDMKESFETLFMCTLPQLSEEGYRIGFCGLLDPDVSKFSAETMMKRSLMHFDLRLQEEKCLGDIYVMDLKLFTISHLKQFSLSFIRKCIDCQIDAMPFRIKQIHFLNASWFVCSFINVFKFFLKEKLKKRIYVHADDFTKFHNSVQKNILPSDYDGQGPSIIELNNAWRDKLIEHRDWFQKIDDESRS